jgi:hypothetical protein
MPTEVTDPEILKRLNGGDKEEPPKATPKTAPTPSPAAPSKSPTRSFFGQLGSDAWESTKHLGTGAARGFLGAATAAGQDVSGYLPMGVLDPALGDVALQETRRRAGEAVKGWTPSKDPKFPISENIGEFLGESAMPSAIAALTPGFGAAKVVEQGIGRLGKWLIGDMTKGMPYSIAGKGGKFAPNPARVAAKEAQKAAEEKVEQRGAKVGEVVKQGEKGALAGVLQPTEDREKGALTGSATAVATEMARRVMGPKLGGAANVVAAAAATAGLQHLLGHNISLGAVKDIGFHEGVMWYALYKMHLGEAAGAIGSKVGQPAVVGGTTAYATGEKRKEERP